ETEAYGYVQYTVMEINNQRQSTAYMLMVKDANEVYNDIGKFRKQLIQFFLAASAVGFALSYFISTWFTRPIRLIMLHLKRITPQERRFSLAYRRKNEIGELVAEITKMVGQLELYE